jgi:hypothetical protein
MSHMLKYIVYETTNLINGKKYIGVHSTDNLDDGYLGSGKLLKKAIKKYGIDSFQRIILVECKKSEDMFAAESMLVTKEWVNDPNTYNLKIGGEGGWDYVNKNPHLRWCGEKRKLQSLKMKERTLSGKWSPKACGIGFTGKTHSIESRKKISEKSRLNNKMRLSQSEIDTRIDQWNSIKDEKGKNKKISLMWNLSHSQVRRFVEKYVNLK